MEVKAVGAVLLLLGCTAMGIGKTGKLYLREKRLRDLQELLQALRTEILYRQTTLEQAMTGSALCIEGGGKAFCQRKPAGHQRGRRQHDRKDPGA